MSLLLILSEFFDFAGGLFLLEKILASLWLGVQIDLRYLTKPFDFFCFYFYFLTGINNGFFDMMI